MLLMFFLWIFTFSYRLDSLLFIFLRWLTKFQFLLFITTIIYALQRFKLFYSVTF
jgi:hypothetical protein